MREASKHTQIIVATHSDRLIGFLDPREILICDIEEGSAKMTWGDTFNLDIALLIPVRYRDYRFEAGGRRQEAGVRCTSVA
jgi:hypothetical protein